MKKRWKLSIERRRMIAGIIFVLPWIVGCILFFIEPLFQSIRLSFSKIVRHAGFQMEWIGMDNYIRAFVWDINFAPMFVQVVQNTLINTPLIVVFSLFIAILINRDIKMRGFFREVFFFPVLLGSGFVMQQLLGLQVDQEAMRVARGILLPREVLVYLGPAVANAVDMFFNRITLVLWKSGVQVLIFLAGLQGIPASLYESARCDSATEWELFWKITLPMISPVILLNIVYTIIDSFTDVTTNPIVNYVIQTAFRSVQFEYAAAIGWIYFVFVFLVVGIVYFVFQKYVYKAGER